MQQFLAGKKPVALHDENVTTSPPSPSILNSSQRCQKWLDEQVETLAETASSISNDITNCQRKKYTKRLEVGDDRLKFFITKGTGKVLHVLKPFVKRVGGKWKRSKCCICKENTYYYCSTCHTLDSKKVWPYCLTCAALGTH